MGRAKRNPSCCSRHVAAGAMGFAALSPSYDSAFAGTTAELIPPSAIHHILQRTTRLKPLDLPRDVFRYLVGIGVGRIVRREHDLRVGPEPAVRWQGLGLEHVERDAAKR